MVMDIHWYDEQQKSLALLRMFAMGSEQMRAGRYSRLTICLTNWNANWIKRTQLPDVQKLSKMIRGAMSDALISGQRFCTFNVLDDFSREVLAIEVDTNLPAARVIRVLERISA